MDTRHIRSREGELLNVIIETPAHTRHKYHFDTVAGVFRLKKILPLGTAFPFDFGFIPNTLGGDGDPLDVLVLMDEASYPGCLIPCRPLALLQAKQQEKHSKPERNDRIIAVADSSLLYAGVSKRSHLEKPFWKELEHFFINYNVQEGKRFTPLGWSGARAVLQLIDRSGLTP